MGGHALSTEAVRMDNDRYATVKAQILQKLKPYYRQCVVPFEKPGKTSHGDLDVICLMDKNTYPSGCDFLTALKSTESKRNGHIVSFEYETHQIDVIHVSTPEEFEFARFFYSFGDVGMITGMILSTVGIKLTDKNLYLHLKNEQKTLHLTDDIMKTFAFMGYDYAQWVHNAIDTFKSEEDIFKWIALNKFFRPEMFKRDGLKCKERKRDADRPMFANFVTYCNKLMENIQKETIMKEKIQYETAAREAIRFFQREQELKDLLTAAERKKVIDSKFNGHLIMKWIPGLQGAALGKVKAAVKEKYPDDVLYKMSEDDIRYVTIETRSAMGPINYR